MPGVVRFFRAACRAEIGSNEDAGSERGVCIVGEGVSSVMPAQKLWVLRPGLLIIAVEAGRRSLNFENRFAYRQRMLGYGENPWPGDWIPYQAAEGIISRTRAVDGERCSGARHAIDFRKRTCGCTRYMGSTSIGRSTRRS